MENITDFSGILWFQCSNQYIIVSWFFSGLFKYVSWNTWTWVCFFVTATELAWPATFKTTKVELDLFSDTGLLLMVGKGIRGGICHVICEYGETNKKYMKDYNKNKE